MRVSRRTFVKVGAAAGVGTYAAWKLGLPKIVDAASNESAVTEEWIPTACWIGKQDCGMLARKVDGRIVKLEGNPKHPRNRGKLCPKGVAQIASLYDPARLRVPLVRTNEKGVPGTWRTATWDEALTLLASKISAAQAKDPRLAFGMEGRAGKVGSIYNDAFPAAVGMKVIGRRGNDCGGASEDSTLATWGDRSAISVDLHNCNYLICYWNLTQAGGPGLCQITYPQQVVEARERGMKVVSIDPYNRSVAHFADEWVPIKPGTDMAFWLAVLHDLIEGGFVDEPFLKGRTNAASLVKADGMLLKQDGKELVWDLKTTAAAPYGASVDPALVGTFLVKGETVKPAFQVLKEHVQSYTPEWAAGVAAVPAAQIRKIARELGENAMIGATRVVDGITVPYRPVGYGIHASATKFHNSIQTNRAILLSFMTLGAIEAVGGPQIWTKKVADPVPNHDKWVKAAGNTKPDNFDLGGSTWFPMGSSGYHLISVTLTDPEKYKVPLKPEDMVVLVNFVNPVLTSRPQDKVLEAWKKMGFVSVITPYLTATADYAGDLVLPCGTLDKWEGPLGVSTLYEKADTLRPPLTGPFGESKSETDIFLDLTEKMGKLTGPKGFIDEMNTRLGIKTEYKLPLDKKPTVPDILNAWTKSKYGVSLDEFQKGGGVVSNKVTADKLYLNSGTKPMGGVRGAFYVEAFVTIPQLQKQNGVPETLWRYYSPFPKWTEPVIEQSPPEYDLYFMDFKRIEYKQTRAVPNPLLAELAPGNPLLMNEATAKKKGLAQGDAVWVESHDPVTGQTRRLRTSLALVQSIRPDTVAMTHHVAKPGDPTANILIPFGEGFWDMGGAWFSHVKVRVSRAGGEAQ